MPEVNLAQMKSGEKGTVKEIQGGHGLKSRAQALGIRKGKKISKLSSQVWRGPVTLRIDNLRIAVGYGMARKIIVAVEEQNK